VIVLALGMCLVQLAKHFPSAGGYFTYVSRTVGPRLGFLTGWMFAFYSPIVAGPALAFLGLILEGEFQSNYQWTWFHWWMLVIVGLPIIAVVGYLGIALSIETIVVVGAIEFLIVLALGLWGLADPGPGGFTLSSFTYGFNPGKIATQTGFALAIVFTVQGLTGWEAAVPAGRGDREPQAQRPARDDALDRDHRPDAVVVIWGQVIGWGVSNLPKLVASPELPALVIAHRVWGSFWWLALFAMFTSVLGASLACQNRRDAHVCSGWPGVARCPSRSPTSSGQEDAGRGRGGAVRAVRRARPVRRLVARAGQDLHPDARLRARDRRDLRSTSRRTSASSCTTGANSARSSTGSCTSSSPSGPA